MKRSLSLFVLLGAIGMMVMFQGCKKSTVPELTTVEITDIALTTATSGGTIVTDGGEEITEKGVCWSTTSNPTVADSKTSDGKGSANFTSSMVGLQEGTTYYVRAYATNSEGTAYGNEVSFKTGQVSSATVTTAEASEITSASAKTGGEVTNAGGGTVSERGISWGTSPSPTVTGANKVASGTGTGTFEVTISGLEDGTIYYYRAYATNNSGTAYGQEYQFITPVTDVEGNVYKTVKIGDQVWMAENLKVTQYNTEDAIPNVTNNDAWTALTTDAYCWANNDAASYKDLYGALYNWHAVNTGNLCPEGWHVPTDAEFSAMEIALGMDQAAANETGDRGTNEGKKLKNTTGWDTEAGNGTNESGFTALPAGYRSYQTGKSEGLRLITYFWSSTERNDDIAYYRMLEDGKETVNRSGTYKAAGKSVRCIKD